MRSTSYLLIVATLGIALTATSWSGGGEPALAAKGQSTAPAEDATSLHHMFTLAINSFGDSFHSGEAIPVAVAVGNAGDRTVYVPNAFDGFMVRVWEVHQEMPSGCMSIPYEPFKQRAQFEETATTPQQHPPKVHPSGGPCPPTDVATEVPAHSGMTWFSTNVIHVGGPLNVGQQLYPGRYRIRVEMRLDAFTKAQTKKDAKSGAMWINMYKPHQNLDLVSNIIEVQITDLTSNTVPAKLGRVLRVPDD